MGEFRRRLGRDGRGTFGKACGDGGYDGRADFTSDCLVDLSDFSLLRGNFGQAGAPPP